MKKLLTLLLSVITLTLTAQNWTATDMNGVSQDITTHSNKAVLVDISAH